jgi:hypothetical protein
MNRLAFSLYFSSLLVWAASTRAMAAEPAEKPAVDYAVPQGNVSELQAFIDRMAKYQPEKPADIVAYRSKFRPALQEAAERILKLEKDHDSEVYEAARFIVLNNRVYWFARVTPAEQHRIIDAVGDYLDEKLKRKNGDEAAAALAVAAAKAIQQTGQWDWAAKVNDSFAARLKTSDNERVFMQSGTMRDAAAQLRGWIETAPKASPPEFSPKGKLTSIDLAKKANVGNTEWFGESYHGNGLAEMPKGDQEFCGVKFKVTEQMMQIGGYGEVVKVPASIDDIPVNQKLHKLYFIQATKHGNWNTVSDGTQVAEYKVHYADGSAASVPVVFAKDVRDWWNRDHGKPVTQGRVAWTGRNPASDKEHIELRLYLGVWENPHPDKSIASLDFVKTDKTNCAPICLAITAEE